MAIRINLLLSGQRYSILDGFRSPSWLSGGIGKHPHTFECLIISTAIQSSSHPVEVDLWEGRLFIKYRHTDIPAQHDQQIIIGLSSDESNNLPTLSLGTLIQSRPLPHLLFQPLTKLSKLFISSSIT